MKIGDTKQEVISTWKRLYQGRTKMQQIVIHTAIGKSNGKMKFSSQTRHVPV